MASVPRSSLVRHFRTLFEVGSVAGLTDGQLLERFLERRDDAGEIAFAAIVDRHGPMVLGVCRRVLTDPNDAADAFQATFLILVRKARSIRVDDSLGRWLYGVSRRVAARARKVSARRPSPIPMEPEALSPDPDRFEFAGILDEELARLPDAFRSALVLCDLGGLTHEEAARDLRCPVGTVKSRLARGRQRLRERLERRGYAPSFLMLAPRAVPASLASSAVRSSWMAMTGGLSQAGMIPAASVILAQGVLKAMAGFQLKLILGTALAGLISAGGGVAALSKEGSEQAPAEKVVELRPQQTTIPPADSKPPRNLLELGRQCFPADHWVNGPDPKFQYSDANQEVAIYSRRSRISEDRKQIHLSPFALAAISNDGNSRQSFTSDDATLSLAEPFDPAKQGADFPKIRHIRMTGNAITRMDKGQTQSSPSEMRAKALDIDLPFDKYRQITTVREPIKGPPIDRIELKRGNYEVEVANGVFRLDGQGVNLEELTKRLKALREVPGEPTPWIFVKAPAETKYSDLKLVIDAITEGGITEIRFGRAETMDPKENPRKTNQANGLNPPAEAKAITRMDPEFLPLADGDGHRLAHRNVGAPGYRVGPDDLIRLEVLEALPGRPLSGNTAVRPDGKISLGSYGEIHVGGLTLVEIKEKVILHLQQFLDDEKLGLRRRNRETGKDEVVAPHLSTRVFVDVTSPDSKFCYVLGEVAKPGRLPIIGRVTVLDAINLAGGLPSGTWESIRLVRRSAPGFWGEQILPIDLDAIVSRGDTKTNYQLMADDLLIVYRDPATAQAQAPATKRTQIPASDLETRLQTVERKLDEVLKSLESLPRR